MLEYVMENIVKNKKAQSSIEFLIIFVFLIMMLVTMSYVAFQKSNNILNNQREYEADRVLKDIVNKINTVFIEGYGFSMNVMLPETIVGHGYVLEIEDNRLKLIIFERVFERLLVTENVIGIDNLEGGVLLLQNVDGTIIITY